MKLLIELLFLDELIAELTDWATDEYWEEKFNEYWERW